MNKIQVLTAILLIFSVSTLAQDMFEVRQLTSDPAQEGFPTWSPEGKFIVYQHSDLHDSRNKNGLWRILPDGTGAKQIFMGIAEHPTWSPDGRFIVFDADTGKSIQMISADSGTIISFLPDSVRIHNGGLPCWSPCASKIAFKDSEYSLFTYDLTTEKVERIYQQDSFLLIPGCWSRDGKSILFSLMDRQSRRSTVWQIAYDGSECKQIMGLPDNFYRYLALSPDGSILAYGAMQGRSMGIYVMPAAGGASLPLAVTSNALNEGASWSPDGREIAFISTRAGSFDIWLMKLNVEQLKMKLGITK